MAQAPIPPPNPNLGTTPVSFAATLPVQDACCTSPCDPAWITGEASCTVFTETKTLTERLGGGSDVAYVASGDFTVNVTYTHTLCLVGKQHGGLAYTLTLLPGEKMTLYTSDRYRRTTSDTERYSVQTTFAQFVSSLYQQQIVQKALNSLNLPAVGAVIEQPVKVTVPDRRCGLRP